MKILYVIIACAFLLSLSRISPAPAAAISTWLCGITGWFFCNLEQAGLVRASPTPRGKVALAEYNLALSKEEVLLRDCSGCRALATLDDGDLMVLGADGIYRWNSRARA